MNYESFSAVEGGQLVAAIAIVEDQFAGIGGNSYPRLRVPINLDTHLTGNPMVDLIYTDLEASLSFEGIGKLADAIPLKLRKFQRGTAVSTFVQQETLEFPLDPLRIAKLERLRNGGDLSLTVDLQMTAEKHAVIDGNKESGRPPLWGLHTIYRLVATCRVTVPRSVWTARVLSPIEHGVVHVIEFPAVPVANWPHFQKSYEALKQAQERHLLGLYDDAVGKCRLALEPFLEHVPVDPSQKDSKTIPILKKSWETKLGKATYDWLNETFKIIKNATNRSHHMPNAHYSQLDSQMIQAITIAVVSYAARTFESET